MNIMNRNEEIPATPETLVTTFFRLNEFQKLALKKLGILSIGNILRHFPVRYGDTSEMKTIGSLVAREKTVIFGKISGLKTGKGFKSKIPMAEARVEDETGTIKIVWFNQPYLAKMIGDGSFVRVEGQISERRKKDESSAHGELYMSNPKIEVVTKLPIGVGESLFKDDSETENALFYPVYPESRGITSNWFYHALQKLFATGILDTITDPIPEHLLRKYNLPALRTALIWMHAPKKLSDAAAAKKRFAFEEIFFIQLEKQRERLAYRKEKSHKINKTEKDIADFVSRFPFALTDAQTKAINHILTDFKKGYAMSRLLEGDVGSGKTAGAAATVYAATTTATEGNKNSVMQTAYMVPTEILAGQHFESFIKYFAYTGVTIGLITGSGCKKFPSKVNPLEATDISKAQLLKWVASGDIPIIIGTHALIQKSVMFKNLAYVIIDEQHRFGTKQRGALASKNIPKKAEEKHAIPKSASSKKSGGWRVSTAKAPGDTMASQFNTTASEGNRYLPHLLSMTATPIPRTLALTIYGDLDLTLLDQMPHGRKPIITEIVLPNEREKTYEKVRVELATGRQAYVICPRIDEPDPAKEMAVQAKSVTEEAARLKRDIFQKNTIGILHSKMKPDEKDQIMLDFKAHKIDILVATSVVEVGVNVPNATVIIIEGAERFGLAQLHQLRGRVIRSNDQAYCFVFAENRSKKTFDRLKALKTAKNGFELAEYDLKFRGAGELSGRKQWGVSDIAMEALQNIKMVEAARLEATTLIETDETLQDFPLTSAELKKRQENRIHFE